VSASPAAAARPRLGPSNAAQAASPRDLLGKTIGGKYFVRSVLGVGGMGKVLAGSL
jgi:hypothetical protein